MPEAQAEIWVRTVNRLPHDWFKPEHIETLKAYCQHAAIANQIAKEIERFDPEMLGQWVEHFEKLRKLLDREHRIMLILARSMRLTHQSQLDRKVAGGRAREWQGARPWEVRA
jgi:hypothetical protein